MAATEMNFVESLENFSKLDVKEIHCNAVARGFIPRLGVLVPTLCVGMRRYDAPRRVQTLYA